PVGARDQLGSAAGGERIGLLQIVEDRLLIPGRVLEAAVAPLGGDYGLGLRAGGARGGIGPELHPVGGRLLLGGEELGRIGEEMGGEGTEGAGRSGGVERLGRLWAQRTLGGGAGE